MATGPDTKMAKKPKSSWVGVSQPKYCGKNHPQKTSKTPFLFKIFGHSSQKFRHIASEIRFSPPSYSADPGGSHGQELPAGNKALADQPSQMLTWDRHMPMVLNTVAYHGHAGFPPHPGNVSVSFLILTFFIPSFINPLFGSEKECGNAPDALALFDRSCCWADIVHKT